MVARTLSHEDARRVYDRVGSLQDSQAFYEDKATRELVEHGGFETATSVFELGCGTGRFAASLLEDRLPAHATYRGIDVSPKMIALARERLARFGDRVSIAISDGTPPTGEPTAAFDRWISTFVFDLLSDDDIDACLAEAHRMLEPGGLLCVTGLSTGATRTERAIAKAWSAIHALSPQLVGGCRPIAILPRLSPRKWRIVHHRSLAPLLVPCEAIVAERLV